MDFLQGAGLGLNFVGGLIQADNNAEIAAANRAQQREFAQNSVQWRVRDAQAAGVHPLAALGHQAVSYAPQAVGDTSVGGAMSRLGQDLSRAGAANSTAEQRQSVTSEAVNGLALERAGLQNELLRAQIRRINNPAAVGPPAPAVSADPYQISGQPDSGVKAKPVEISPGAPSQPHSEAGAVSDVGYARTTTGWAPVPSKDVKERIEDNLIQEVMWAVRNNLMPTMGNNRAPPPFSAPPGQKWTFNTFKQEYQLVNIGGRAGTAQPLGRR